MPDMVWVLSIDHKHGTNVSVHRSEAGARAELYDFVAEWWDDEMPITSIHPPHRPIMPTDPGEVITRYFETIEDEDYAINLTTIED